MSPACHSRRCTTHEHSHSSVLAFPNDSHHVCPFARDERYQVLLLFSIPFRQCNRVPPVSFFTILFCTHPPTASHRAPLPLSPLLVSIDQASLLTPPVVPQSHKDQQQQKTSNEPKMPARVPGQRATISVFSGFCFLPCNFFQHHCGNFNFESSILTRR